MVDGPGRQDAALLALQVRGRESVEGGVGEADVVHPAGAAVFGAEIRHVGEADAMVLVVVGEEAEAIVLE